MMIMMSQFQTIGHGTDDYKITERGGEREELDEGGRGVVMEYSVSKNSKFGVGADR